MLDSISVQLQLAVERSPALFEGGYGLRATMYELAILINALIGSPIFSPPPPS